jgi:hypothetical protein
LEQSTLAGPRRGNGRETGGYEGEAGGDGGNEAVKGIAGERPGMAGEHDGEGQADRRVGGKGSGGEELGGAEPVRGVRAGIKGG